MNGKTAMDAFSSALSMMPYWLEFLDKREQELEAQLNKARARSGSEAGMRPDADTPWNNEGEHSRTRRGSGESLRESSDRETDDLKEAAQRSDASSAAEDRSERPDFLRE